MSSAHNTQVLLDSRPRGWPTEANFRIVETPIPEPGEGELLVRVHWLSLDPYMRGRMNDGKSYAAKVELGEVMIGGAVGEVVRSNNPAFKEGDFLVGSFGWQEYALSKGNGVMKVDPARAPLSAYLGAVGMPGITAYIGLLDIGAPKAGETVVVSAASGAVGCVVGQIAKMRGCRAVGIAGGAAKCALVMGEFGFDACIDYKAGPIKDELKKHCPRGVDVFFDNVGGEILEAVLARLAVKARIGICGAISQINFAGRRAGAEELHVAAGEPRPHGRLRRPRPRGSVPRGPGGDVRLSQGRPPQDPGGRGRGRRDGVPASAAQAVLGRELRQAGAGRGQGMR